MGKNELLKTYIKQNYEQYSGLILERYFREKLKEIDDITEIGNYWDSKGQNEIDVIALSGFTKKVIIAEVKRNPQKINISKLEDKAASIKKYLFDYEVELRYLSMEDV